MSMISEPLLKFWLALIWAPQLSILKLRELFECGLSVEALFLESSKVLKAHNISEQTLQYVQNPAWDKVEQHLSWASNPDHSIVCMTDPRYPELLLETADPPLILFVRGNTQLLQQPQIAMVGSRKPTPSGRQIAINFAKELVGTGVVITSGLAHGIDTASHQGALSGMGQTIAVMGTGLDQIYPIRNTDLGEQIAELGALVSEYPLGTPPRPGNFPRRNRVVTGMSLGTVVVEAKLKSGTLISARLAMEQNREVFAIPGSINATNSAGCHYLIKNGAKLTETVGDILEEIPQIHSNPHHACVDNNSHLGLDVDHQALLECIDFEGTDMDTLLARVSGNIEEASLKLLNLQMEGLISSVPGGYARTAI